MWLNWRRSPKKLRLAPSLCDWRTLGCCYWPTSIFVAPTWATMSQIGQHRSLVETVPEGSATAKALDYCLRRWEALTRFVGDGQLPGDNNWIENQIRPIAIGRNNWLFAGSLRAGQRAAAVMSLIQSARMSGQPLRLSARCDGTPAQQRANQIGELLPHRWKRPLQKSTDEAEQAIATKRLLRLSRAERSPRHQRGYSTWRSWRRSRRPLGCGSQPGPSVAKAVSAAKFDLEAAVRRPGRPAPE